MQKAPADTSSRMTELANICSAKKSMLPGAYQAVEQHIAFPCCIFQSSDPGRKFSIDVAVDENLASRCNVRAVQQVIADKCAWSQIIGALDKEERRLFRDKIRQLDRRILPGANKLIWASSKHSLDHYYKECGW